MEDSLSSTNLKHKALLSVSELEFSSEDSGWSLYIDDSVTSSNIESTAFCSRSGSSSIFSLAASSAAKMHCNGGHVASARSISKRRKIKASFVDPDLEDTASSPLYSSKIQEFEQLHMKVQETDSSLSLLPPTQPGEHDFGSLYQESSSGGPMWKDISYTGLREKGLCLVPVSMLFNF